MKKYVFWAIIIVIAGIAINYSLGGFDKIEPTVVRVSNYTLLGKKYQGSYKSKGLSQLVDSLRKVQETYSDSRLVIVNYENKAKEAVGIVDNFVGLLNYPSNSGNGALGSKTILAREAIRLKVNVKPLITPIPVKLDKIAKQYALAQGVELQGISIEQYLNDNTLQIDYPIKIPFTKEEELIAHIAERYGIDYFNEDKTYTYTFNVKKGKAQAARAWSWQPKSGEVTLVEKEDTTRFNHLNLEEGQKLADHKFINDNYWLLFPFHLSWDTGFTATLDSASVAPISNKACKKITITYNSSDGYTPGDAYDFYINQEYRIIEWSFRKGNKPVPSLTTTWQDEKSLNGLIVSTNHLSADSTFRLWFSGISIQ